MSTRGAPDNWLGTSGDWGLTRHKHGELCDELSDHLSEMARVESHGSAQDAKDTLVQPKVRRKLAGVHLADQVYATLNRLPDKQEWRELMWLGVWFVFVLLADYSAFLAEQTFVPDILGNPFSWVNTGIQYETPGNIVWPSVVGWLLQGIARAGFYSQFILSLLRAYKTGWGVLIARVLQLKLIHTVMIFGGAILFRGAFEVRHLMIYAHPVDWPHWLIAPVVVAPVAIAAIAMLYSRKPRLLGLGWGLALAALFLYPGGPTLIEHIRSQRPIAFSRVAGENGERILVVSNDTEKAKSSAVFWETCQNVESVDPIANRLIERKSRTKYLPGHGLSIGNIVEEEHYGKTEDAKVWSNFNSWRLFVPSALSETISTETQVIAPVCFTGAGLGWLTAAIPLLAIIGSIGLIAVMGRRGITEFIAYSLVVAGNLAFTLAPCFYFTDLSATAFITMPFVFFTMVIIPNEFLVHTTTLGLLLSAGAPWLLTGLFLKPGRPPRTSDDADKMQEAGA